MSLRNNALTGPGKEWILLWSSNLWALGEGMLGPLFAVFAQRIGGNILDITWAWSQAGSALPWPWR